MALEHFSPDAPANEVADAIRRDGAAIIDQLAPPELVGRVRSEVTPFLDDTPFGPDGFSGRRTRRTGSLIRDLCLVPRVPRGSASVRLFPVVADADVDGFLCELDGGGIAPCSPDKTVTNLVDGTHTFSVRSFDAAGNQSTTVSRTWTVDRTAPTVTITSPTAGSSHGASVRISGTASEGSDVTINVSGSPADTAIDRSRIMPADDRIAVWRYAGHSQQLLHQRCLPGSLIGIVLFYSKADPVLMPAKHSGH